MKDANKNKTQLIAELQEARRRISELERTGIHPESSRETASKPMESLRQIQRDLGLALSAVTSLADTYKICLETAIKASGMDSGGIYRVEQTGELHLVYHQGLSREFIQQVSRYEANAPTAKIVRAGQPVYVNYPEMIRKLGLDRAEQLKVLAVIPIHFKNRIVAVFNMASHSLGQISDFSRVVLETIASQMGAAIVRAQKERELEQSQRQLRAIFDGVEDFMFILDETGCILDINASVTRRLGYSGTKLIGQPVFMVHPPDQHEKAIQFVNEMLAGQRDTCFIPLLTTEGKLIPVETRIFKSTWDNCDVLIGICRDVTERSRAEWAYKKLVEDSIQGLVILQDGVVVFANPALVEIVGYTRDELLAFSPAEVQEMVHPDDREWVLKNLADRIAGKDVPQHQEFRILRKNGVGRWVQIFVSPIEYQDHPALQISFFDITEQKRAELALRESEERFKKLSDLTFEGIIFHKGGVIMDANKSVAKITGYEIQELLGRNIVQLCVLPEYHATIKQNIVKKIAKPYEVLVKRKDGSVIPVEIEARDVTAHGEAYRVAALRDLTERKQAEIELKESKLLLQNVVDATPACIYVKDINGKYVFVNKFITDLYGTTPSEMIGKTDIDFAEKLRLTKAEAQAFIRHDQEVIKNRHKKFVNEESFTLPDGTQRWFQTRKLPISLHDNPNCMLGVSEDITERKRAEDMLRESEEQYRLLVETAIEGIWAMDSEHRTRFVNQSMATMLGYTPGEMLGKKVENFFFEEDLPFHEERMRARHTGSDEIYERRLKKRDGSSLWTLVSAKSLKNSQGLFAGSFAMFTDITDRKHTENLLRESEEKYRGVVENIGIGVALISPKMEILTINQQMKNWFPKIDDSKKLVCYHEFNNPPRNQVCSYCPTIKTFQDGLVHDYIKEIPSGNEIIYHLIVSSPIKDDAGKIIAVIEMVEDITERKRAEEALRRSEAKLRLLFANIHDVFFSVDRNGTITEVSPSVENILGYKPVELTGKLLSDLNIFAPESQEHVLSDVMKLLDGETIKMVEYEFIARDGTHRFGEVSGSPIVVNQEVIAFASVARDITERKRAVADKAKLEEHIRRSQKLETIGTLAGGIAHDFNNLLTPIMGYAEMSISSLPLTDPLVEDLEQILTAANRARDLVEQILIFSRQLEKERKPLSLHLIVKEVLKLLRPAIPTTVEIRQRIDSSGDKVLADATQMHQIMVNLCTNAWQAMETKGGTLTIELQQVVVDTGTAKNHPSLAPAKYARLTVMDTGIGMNEATLDRIFEPFFTTKAVGKGTGMGLAVVHGIVHSHHGEIFVQSTPGKGTTFHVYIPTVTAEGIAENAEVQPIPRGHESIMIVDDEAAVGNVVRKLLERLEYQVTVFQSSLTALKVFRQQPDKYDLVISDLTMPNLTGLELTQQLHRTRAKLPVILMTGYGEDVSEEIRIQSGIQYILQKPTPFRELANLIRKVLDNSGHDKKRD